MSRPLKYLHLEYNLTKPLQAQYSIAGIVTLTCAMIGVAIGTLLTKGRIPASHVVYLPDPQDPGYSCNSTLIYPGQTLGSIAQNTSFKYQAVSQFAYSGQRLNNCTLLNITYIDVIGPPLSYPRISVNQTVSCNLPGRSKDDDIIVNFDVGQLQTWGYITRIKNMEFGGLCVDLLAQLATYQAPWNLSCNSSQPVAFRINEPQMIMTVFPLNTPGNEICSFSLDFAPEALTLIAVAKAIILEDWTTNLAILPDLQYPCVQQKKIWGPFWTVLLDVLTTMFAFFSPLMTLLLMMLRYLQERREGRNFEVEGASRPLHPLCSSSTRDEGLSLLSLFSPDNLSSRGDLEDSRLLLQRLENIVEAFQARIHQMEAMEADSTPGTRRRIASETTLSPPQLQKISTVHLQTS
ncbi:hypothetical protein DL93DRAFT_2159419 [Clavulina sp. PMI_390]|nr:hypothetical protein DL93DRAFT_2159419 [Clavulina sp. PMI_390]